MFTAKIVGDIHNYVTELTSNIAHGHPTKMEDVQIRANALNRAVNDLLAVSAVRLVCSTYNARYPDTAACIHAVKHLDSLMTNAEAVAEVAVMFRPIVKRRSKICKRIGTAGFDALDYTRLNQPRMFNMLQRAVAYETLAFIASQLVAYRLAHLKSITSPEIPELVSLAQTAYQLTNACMLHTRFQAAPTYGYAINDREFAEKATAYAYIADVMLRTPEDIPMSNKLNADAHATVAVVQLLLGQTHMFENLVSSSRLINRAISNYMMDAIDNALNIASVEMPEQYIRTFQRWKEKKKSTQQRKYRKAVTT